MTSEEQTTALTIREDADLAPRMVSDIPATKARLKELQAFVAEIMERGEDFDIIPGTQKPALLKPGAEKLCEVYGYAIVPVVVNRIEDWDRPLFHYEVRCDLVSKRTGKVIGSGFGSCNSLEARYRWRDASRKCPACGKETIIKGKAEYGGGWLCFAKKGGCGAKYADDAKEITGQTVGRVENDDVFTIVNTVLKMAKKRSLVDATLSVTRSSALFTQDEEVIEASSRPVRMEKPTKPAKPDGITEGQGKRLKERAKAAGHSLTDVAAWLAARYDARTLGEIKRADYDAIIVRLDKTAPLGSLPEDTEEPPAAGSADADAENIPFEPWEQP